jgi:hypothetical protein
LYDRKLAGSSRRTASASLAAGVSCVQRQFLPDQHGFQKMLRRAFGPDA